MKLKNHFNMQLKSKYIMKWNVKFVKIRKVIKTQHQNPEFGHTQGEIKKNPAEEYISIQGGMKLIKPSILVVN
jgi:hypothetical protein